MSSRWLWKMEVSGSCPGLLCNAKGRRLSAGLHRQNFPKSPPLLLGPGLPRSRTATTITGYSTITYNGDRIAPAVQEAEERGH